MIKESKERFLIKLGKIQFNDDKLEFFNKIYPALIMRIKKEDLNKSTYLLKVTEFLNNIEINDSKDLIDINKLLF
ncbi:MAG: hypothetical protein ACFFAN_11020 [Promethearchaeota archaeon]